MTERRDTSVGYGWIVGTKPEQTDQNIQPPEARVVYTHRQIVEEAIRKGSQRLRESITPQPGIYVDYKPLVINV